MSTIDDPTRNFKRALKIAKEAKANMNKVLEKDPKPNQATQILGLLEQQDCEFFHAEGRAYASFDVNGHRETWPIRRKVFRQWVAHQFYVTHKKIPGNQALQDAINVLEGKAIFEGMERQVFVRVGGNDAEIFLDMANDAWEMIHITAQGWNVVPHNTVKFKRGTGMKPLPVPVGGGSLETLLKPFINLSTPNDWRLLIGWLVNAVRPTGSQLGVQIDGEQGAGKTTVSDVLKEIIDPNAARERSEPRTVQDLMIATTSNWLLAFDNLSGLPLWLSDGLCRLSTGGAFGTRQLFTDEDEILFEARRPVIVNGIGSVVTRPDLLDRYIILSLDLIPEDQRQPEREFWNDFHVVSGQILGTLCDAVVGALRNRPTTMLPTLERMAEAVLWATAAESTLGWPSGDFQRAYAANREGAHVTALESSLLFEPICKLLKSDNETKVWTGTSAKLLSELSAIIGESKAKPRGWPAMPRKLRSDLQRIVPNLRSIGIKVTFPKPNEKQAGGRPLTLERVCKTPSRSSEPSRSCQLVEEVAGLAGQKHIQSKSCEMQETIDLC